ncbi:macrophage mannose receptor 1-like [Hoplias malabaricus]|uniref:macrophage mannose receptor 1-like n=1 Tax=Hoplias malabaricus TaxID=27720 RepID=UPI0034629350
MQPLPICNPLRGPDCYLHHHLVRARVRCFRLAAVCLGLLCILLLITSIVLYKKYIHLKEEKDSMSKNIFSLRANHLINIKNLTKERDQLKSSYQNLTEEMDQLKDRNQNLTEEMDQLKSRNQDLKCMKSFGSSFYHISTDFKTWNESRQDCRDKGADLLIINNKEEQEFIKKQDIYTWLGLSDEKTEGLWKWVDGSLAPTEFWINGEPNDYNGEEDCAVFSETADPLKTWNDIPCSYTAKWICEYTLFSPKVLNFISYLQGIKSLGSSYYYISNDFKTWSDARNVCKAKGADLLIINSKEEQEFIKKLNLYVWLGLTDAENEGEWKWVDGSVLTIKFWKTGEPNDAHGDEDCVAFAETSDPLMTWNDIPCSYKAGWICEYTYAML